MPTPASLQRSVVQRRVRTAVAPLVATGLRPFDRIRRPIDRSLSPIFICGCSHSGTTVTLRMIGGLADVYAIPYESNIFMNPRLRSSHAAALRAWLDEAKVHGKGRICEKTPNHVFRLEHMLRLYPAARVVVVIRDGRDVAASLARRWEGDVERGARKWVESIEASRPFWADERVTVVRHEDSIAAPEATLQRMCAHVGEPFDPAAVAGQPGWKWLAGKFKPAPSDDVVSTAGHSQNRAWQVSQPIFDSRGKWRRQLDGGARRQVAAIAGPTLVELGYATPDEDWITEPPDPNGG